MGKFQSHFLKNNTIPLGFPSWNRERVVELQGRETTDTWKKWNRWNCSFFIITPLYNKILVIHIILLWSMLYQFYINAIHGCKVRSLLHSSKFIKSLSVRFFANHESKLLSQCFGAALGMFPHFVARQTAATSLATLLAKVDRLSGLNFPLAKVEQFNNICVLGRKSFCHRKGLNCENDDKPLSCSVKSHPFQVHDDSAALP